MAHVLEHHELEFALHLCDGQFLVHSICCCQDQELPQTTDQEALSESKEPFSPELFRLHEIHLPSVGAILLLNNTIGHGHSGTLEELGLVVHVAPLDHFFKRPETLRPRLNNLLHHRQHIQSRSLHDINDHIRLNPCLQLRLLLVLEYMRRQLTRYSSTHRMPQNDETPLIELLHLKGQIFQYSQGVSDQVFL